DLFFHCESIGEADDLLDKCMKYIGSLALKKICYKRSQYVQTIKILNTLSIKFIRRVYKTKDQILLGFDLAGSRLGWNPKDGLFATICGALAFAMRGFALDLTRRNISFGHRINKYIHKGFHILLPGVSVLNNIETPDGILKFHKDKQFSFCTTITEKSSDDNDNDKFINWVLICDGRDENVTFLSNKLDDIY